MKKKICLSILLLFISLNFSAQDLKWIGTENTDFFNENNYRISGILLWNKDPD